MFKPLKINQYVDACQWLPKDDDWHTIEHAQNFT